MATPRSARTLRLVSGFLPRIHETAAPHTAISAAAVKTIVRPWWNGPEIRVGKNVLPVSVATFAAGSVRSSPVGASRFCTGL